MSLVWWIKEEVFFIIIFVTIHIMIISSNIKFDLLCKTTCVTKMYSYCFRFGLINPFFR